VIFSLKQAAWGRLQKGGTQLFISNFEIGVVLKRHYSHQPSADLTCAPEWEKNLPFMIPAPHYTNETEPFLPDKYFSVKHQA